MNQQESQRCPVCLSTDLDRFFDLPAVPVYANVLWPTQEQALSVAKGEMRLAFCRHCGHIFNTAFRPELMDYNESYENSLHFSARFQNYVDELAERLVSQYDLRGKELIEIGSGKGEFLTELCQMGGNRGTGYDPNYGGNGSGGPVTFVQDYYSEQYAGKQADFICSRQTLEHVPQPREFLAMLRRSIGDRTETVVFFEVPNALFTLRELSIWDLIYEHVSYFTAESLSYLFRDCGFEVLDVREAFGGQYLTIEARPCDHAPQGETEAPDLTRLTFDLAAFLENYRRKTQEWQSVLQKIRSGDKKAVVWSAGSKGVTFLNLMQVKDEIPYVVDINPRKQGMFISGAGQQIIPPERLREVQPDWIILMNPIYRSEIGEMARSLGLGEVEFLQA